MTPADSPRDPSHPSVITAPLVVEALRALIEALKANPELADSVRDLLSVEAPLAASTAPPYMSMSEYARHARLSERTVQSLRAEMTEGVHFHRDGRTGRRVIIHVEEADAWRAARRPQASRRLDLDRLAEDEVSLRRARASRRAGAAGA